MKNSQEKGKERPKIWALFSHDNHYDQPPNPLVAWWFEKPSLEQLGEILGVKLNSATEDKIVVLVNIWTGVGRGELPFRIDNTDYELKELEEGKLK